MTIIMTNKSTLFGYSLRDYKYRHTQSDIDRFLARCHYRHFAE